MDAQTLMQWRGRDVLDRDGDKIGTFEDLYLDAQTERPQFLLVKTGMFGRRGTFVPVGEATGQGEALQVPFEKAQVKAAPGIEPEAQLSETEEAEIYRHYGLSYADSMSSGGGEGEGSHGGGESEQEHQGGAAQQPPPPTGEPQQPAGQQHEQQPTGEQHQQHHPGQQQAPPTGEQQQHQAGQQQAEGHEGQPAGSARRLRKFIVTEETRVDSELVTEQYREER